MVKKAELAYSNGEYLKAVELYEQLAEGEESKYIKSSYQFIIAECYRHLNDSKKAEIAYKKIAKQKSSKEKMATYWYGYYLLKSEKYDEAEKCFKAYKKSTPRDHRGANGIESCSLAVAYKEKPTRYVVENIKALNTKYNDFGPMYSDNNFDAIYFTSSRIEEGVKPQINQVSGMNYTDIYEARYDRKGKWQAPEKILDSTVNCEFDDGNVSISSDGFTMYFTRCLQELGKNLGCQIYTNTYRNGAWHSTQLVEIVPDSISIGQPAISPDGLTLYFSSRMKGGHGGSDIWKVERASENGMWGRPVNLGASINTEGDEMFPYVRQDGTLYFASDGLPGMGGLDIFRAVKNDDGKWTVVNMQYPINSSQDDFGIVFQGNKEIGLLTSNRKGTRGLEDIYSFELPELKLAVEGTMIDVSINKPIVEGDVTLIGSDGSLQTAKTKQDGTYLFKLEQYVDYIIIGSFDGFLKKKVKISTANISDDTTFSQNLDLITMSKPVEIPNIYYDAGKWTLNDASKAALEQLGKLLEDNPNITIELGAHTDMVGDANVNLQLSKRRAQAVVDYLAQKGYDVDRLVAQGYGESKPVVVTEEIAKLDSAFVVGMELSQEFLEKQPREVREKANQINRRTELRILSTDYIPKPEYFMRQKNNSRKGK
ncbi:MAG: OmpA family protein [Bacteroidales bacterium]|nr:OmpA family protein [Bacteroidales bacterium]